MPGIHSDRPVESQNVHVKKALCIAIRYHDLAEKFPDEPLDLRQCHKDPRRIRKMLIDLYGYQTENIRIMMDDSKRYDPNSTGWPTRENILRAIDELVKDAKPGDHLVFQFSGHGSQIPNTDGTEEDHLDEVIWPADVEYTPSDDPREMPDVQNYIIDNTLKQRLVDSLPKGIRFTAILDCCHSGTGLDLPFSKEGECDKPWSPIVYSPVDAVGPLSFRGFASVDHPGSLRMPYEAEAGVEDSGAVAVRAHGHQPLHTPGLTDQDSHITSWSACLDGQIGLEAGYGGVLIHALDDVLRANHHRLITHRDVLSELSEKLFTCAVKAKKAFKEAHMDLTPMKPVLGSLQESGDILDMPFTL